MSLLQQELRRLLQKLKGKQPFSQQNFNELLVLAPINPQNTPIQKNRPKLKTTDILKEVSSQENFPQKVSSLSSKSNRVPVIFSRNEVYQPTSLKMPSFKREKEKTLRNPAQFAETREFSEKAADFAHNEQDLFEDRGFLEEKTKKSPVLREENCEFPIDFEQNTIIKVKLEGCQGIPEVNQSKEQDEIVEKIGEFVKLRQSQENYLSFQRFQERNSAEKLDILEKTQKLSFREEDFFEKSMKIEEFVQEGEHDLEFRLLNENRDQRENTGNFKENEEDFNENQGNLCENQENLFEIRENFYKKEEIFNENREILCENREIDQNSRTENLEEYRENCDNIEKSVEKIQKPESFGSFLSSPSSFSQQFSRPFDLKPDQRDHYIDEIYLKFRFANDSRENSKDLENFCLEKETFLRINFDKNTVQRMRNALNLDELSPENIVEEVFNAQKLSRISKTFFKIKMQVKK